MLKLIFCIHRNSNMTREEFHHYWLVEHASLVKKLACKLGAIRYVQSHTYESVIADKANGARNSALELFDGITEFWWKKEEDFFPQGSSVNDVFSAQKQLLEDEKKFIDLSRSVIFMAKEFEIYNENNLSELLS